MKGARSTRLKSEHVKAAALSLGFDACGIAEAASLTANELHLRPWLDNGCHAEMHYMAEHVDMRYDPRLLLPGARSVISVLLGYKPSQRMGGKAKIAQYAYDRSNLSVCMRFSQKAIDTDNMNLYSHLLMALVQVDVGIGGGFK